MISEENTFELRIDGVPVEFHLNIADRAKYRHIWKAGRHNNAMWELNIILRGSAGVNVADRHYTLTAGQALLIAPGLYHDALSVPGEFDRFACQFALPPGAFSGVLARRIPAGELFCLTPEIERLCRSIYDEYGAQLPFWRDVHEATMTLLMANVFRLLGADRASRPQEQEQSVPSRVSLIDDYLQRHIDQKIRIGDLAELLHLSSRQTARILLENYGMSFSQKLLTLRMERGAYLLRSTDKPLSEIIGMVSYLSESAFYQAFHRYYHMTPLRFRKQFSAPEPADGE